MNEQRRLAAILVADVVGYSKLVGNDEAGTLARLAALRREVIEPTIARHAGRLFKAVGDGFLVEFASAVQAVTAARAIQEANAAGDLPLRIGIHVGDVVVQGDDLMGDGVNIAARIEGLADAGGIAISRQVRDQVRDKMDVGLIDKGEVELKNILRPVRVFTVNGTKAPAQVNVLTLPDKPSIAVLPFQNMSGDPEQEYFADGMVEDIITALSRTKALFVIARNSSFSYKGKSPDIRQVGRELGVRYVLEGSVRKAGARIRITGQLIDAQSGAHLWADRFDGALEDIFDLQDQIASRVVGEVAPALEEAEITRAARKVSNLEAYDYYLRGLAALPGYYLENLTDAQSLLAKAVALDPKLAIAWATQAFRCVGTKSMVRDSDPARNAAEAEHAARTALRLDRNDARVLAFSGHSLGFVCRHYEEAAALLEEAVRLDPNLAVGWTWRGTSRNRFGQPELAISDLERAMRLSPRDAFMFLTHGQMAAAHLFAGRYDEAVQWADSSLRLLPHHVTAHRVLVAAHALAGRTDAARRTWLVYRKLDPETRLTTLSERLAIPSGPSLAKFAEGLRLAGMPE
jgi:TolB-like protein/Tfp pilus assembly protein PilF